MFGFIAAIKLVGSRRTTGVGSKRIYEIALEAISKKGFWLKFKAGPNFNPQAYSSIPRS